MERFGIGHRKSHLKHHKFPVASCNGWPSPGPLSIIRQLLLADEPTAHLDSSRSRELMDHLVNLRRDGKTIVLTSHDPLVTEHPEVTRVVDIQDGRIISGESICS